jgi:hypothetical protein
MTSQQLASSGCDESDKCLAKEMRRRDVIVHRTRRAPQSIAGSRALKLVRLFYGHRRPLLTLFQRITALSIPGGISAVTRFIPSLVTLLHLSVALMLRVRPLTGFRAVFNWRDCALLKMLA